jgi:formate C-acetyltransferase
MPIVLDHETQPAQIAWHGFTPGVWQTGVNVRDFIQCNYTPYEGDSAFLQGPTSRTRNLWQQLLPLLAQEREKGVLDVSQAPSGILAHGPGYIDKDHEIIVGLQTDAPLKRAIMPFGGWRVVEASLSGVRLHAGPASRGDLHQVPQDAQRRRVRRLHAGHQKARRSHIVTGLPDAVRPRAGSSAITGGWRSTAWTF